MLVGDTGAVVPGGASRPDFRDLEFYRNAPAPLTVNVSGGRSSAYQAAHIIEANGRVPEGVPFLFNNTGKERRETYDFIQKFDNYYGIGIIWTEYDPAVPGKFRRVDYATASRNGEPFERLLSEIVPKRRDGSAGVRPLPNPTQRTCTAALKVKTAHRFLRREMGWPTRYYSAIGYRADEPSRYEKRVARELRKPFDEGGNCWCPMYHAGVISDRVQQFWRTMPFDLELDSDFGNCDLCFMASTWKIKARMVLLALESQTKLSPGTPPPASVAQWIAWEERESDRPGTFRKDRPTIRALWDQVCAGDFEAVGNGALGLVCGACTD